MLNFNNLRKRRQQQVYSIGEYQLIKAISHNTEQQNVDNVSRTHAYIDFFDKHSEMEWALLASMVSRNAGWNMTDLKCEKIFELLSDDYLKVLFHTYERPNWLIFHDAYPQLLLYSASVQQRQPLFHLLKAFGVSIFMEMEWESFWRTGDKERICYALIINEQHVIEEPVIRNYYFARQVFEKMIFKIGEFFRLSAVVFPDLHGHLYGFSVRGFQNVGKRIKLGKRLHRLLFNENVSEQIQTFALVTEHTGARFDYEKYIGQNSTKNQQSLRFLYNVIHHQRLQTKDWFRGELVLDWFKPVTIKNFDITERYRNKRDKLSHVGHIFSHFKKQ